MSVLSIPTVLINNKNAIPRDGLTLSMLQSVDELEGSDIDAAESICRQALLRLNNDSFRKETTANEIFHVFDDYFDISRTAEKCMEVYSRYLLQCILIFREEIKDFNTTLSRHEQENLLHAMVDALRIGVEYLSYPDDK
ncbi:hypothetical protein [Serratia rubidaea]|uniref:Uncharacterized protein n=1 Tax=Serratia rubidaea TaxID=61652 RepID=A0A3S5F2G3_SERRU|nr:hypothetical protein [Serratia rubidaea]MBH1932541.1 hypothetical protein [Serratia rubidaea]MDC6119165.1 hypothetical protein [Serratia rubidaea]MEB7584951.1 hypothetical protein [Serratia rubidaea]VEI70447.1 Uncharacterised protein [Serratia rubidaea]